MKRVSVKQAIFNAISETDEALGRYPNQMLSWAKHIEREIGSLNGYKIKAKTFNITGCYLDLPKDCYRVIGVIKGDYEDECNIQYRDIEAPIINEDMIVDGNLLSRENPMYWIPLDTTWISESIWEEIGDQLHLIQKYENQDMTLIYNINEMDLKGDWIVNESHIEAITKYIVYMYAKKFRWKIFKSDKLLRQGHIETLRELERDYSVAVRHARAEDGTETIFETMQY